ncbi:MAG: tyrosine-type recombinase/integrase [Bacteroidales bacterium]
MNRKKIAILAKLNDGDGDLTKQWFIYFSYRDHRSGKMIRIREFEGLTQKTKRDRYKAAERLIQNINHKLRKGWNPLQDVTEDLYEDQVEDDSLNLYRTLRKTNKTLVYYTNEFLTLKTPNVSGATYTTYKSKFRITKNWLTRQGIVENDITSFSSEDALRFIQHLIEKRKVSNNTLRQYLLLFNALFNDLVERQIIADNPFRKIKIKKQPAVPARYFNNIILTKIKNFMTNNDPQLWLVSQLQYYCFIRPKEIRFLKIKNVDLDQGVINIPGEISKNKKTQTVLIPSPFLVELFKMELNQYPDDYYLIGVHGKPSSRPVSKNYLWNRFRNVRMALNISQEHKLYSFKHTGAVRASKVVPLKDLQMQLRHHSLDQVDAYLRQMTGNESDEIRDLFPEL